MWRLKMEFFIGTSGWAYSWNEEGTLSWYVKNTKSNAVELNASFYRFPYRNQIVSWIKKGAKLRWSIKVNRTITHRFRLSDRSYYVFSKFLEAFKPMEKAGLIDFYLIQLPPTFMPKAKNVERIKAFLNEFSEIKNKLAFEFRHEEWFSETWVNFFKRLEVVFVSIDAPGFESKIFKTTDKIYLRLHGRTSWYSHIYSKEELIDILERIIKLEPEKVYIFLNNDHGMLPTEEKIIEILESKGLW